jgi:putative NIF3 family GTP cyclohydrolase 1 type 2
MEWHSALRKTDKVAVLGGFGSYAIKMQLWLVQMLLTADLKYHQFYEAENQLFSRYWTF